MAKILIVDDSIVARMSVKGCIPKDQGHELFEAGDGFKAIEMFRSVRPDVTFLDLTMPDKNGLEVLEELKKDFPEAIIIVLSADIQKQTQEIARQLGAFAIAEKPPVKDVVQAELARALVIAGGGAMSEQEPLLTTLEKDVLQEIMNIAFGEAAADLSEVIDLYVTLTVPEIDLLDYQEIFSFIKNEMTASSDMGMVEQFFSGRFSGSSVLIFPRGEGKKLLQMFSENAGDLDDSAYDIDLLEKETLIEISNIIMGACVAKIAQLLGDVVSYSPPRYFAQDQINKTLEDSFAKKESFAIFFKTVFHFQEHDTSGFLFLVCDPTTLEWLKHSVGDYLKQHT